MAEESPWRAGGCSATGPRPGRKNQDAACWSPSSGTGSRAVIAVSDGHGAHVHHRSERGAQAAVARIVDLLSWRLDQTAAPEASGLVAELLLAWRRSVDQDIVVDPLPGAPKGFDRLTPYGATLIAFGVSEARLILLQIGDGEAFLGYPDGRIERPFTPDRLSSQQTYSLCLPGAARYFRVLSLDRSLADVRDADWPDFAFLATDGVTRATQGDALAADLRTQALTDWGGAVARFAGTLAALSARSGDDATACMALAHATESRSSWRGRASRNGRSRAAGGAAGS